MRRNSAERQAALHRLIRAVVKHPRFYYHLTTIDGSNLPQFAAFRSICDIVTRKAAEKQMGQIGANRGMEWHLRRCFKIIRILFICHGNICRSPMCEFVFRDMVRQSGLSEQVAIASAATSCEELGNPVYPPARRILEQHGISCEGKTARRMNREDYNCYDRIIAMDRNNLRNMCRICGADDDGKFSLLMDYTDRPGDVADPWYTRDFEATWRDVEEGCRGLLKDITQQLL